MNTELKASAQWILDRLSELKDKKVLVVGDVGLDVYIFGEVKRLSPEAPVPILDVAQEDLRLGLAANVAQNIQTLGGQSQLVSVVGEDLGHTDLKNLLQKNRVSPENLVADSGRPTTRKLRLIAGQHHIARVDYEKQNHLSEAIKQKVLQRLEELLPKSDIVILQDYSKGMFDQDLSQKLIQMATRQGKKVLVDPYRSTPLAYYKGAYLMTPNRDEALALSKQVDFQVTEESVEKIGSLLMKEIQSPKMVVTLGAAGMRIFEENKSSHLPTFAQSVFDVTGAGDTVISAIALALAAGWPLEKACYLANVAAGIVVGKVGCVPCHLDEVAAALQA